MVAAKKKKKVEVTNNMQETPIAQYINDVTGDLASGDNYRPITLSHAISNRPIFEYVLRLKYVLI